MSVTFIYFVLPFFMIIYGIYRYYNIPGMDSDFGFKTKYSMINKETYIYANKKISEYYIRSYCIIYIFIIAMAIFYICFSKDMNVYCKILFFVLATVIEILGFVLPIRLVNKKLKNKYFQEYTQKQRNFNKYGEY